MWDTLESTWFFALVRAIHFASCLLAFGVVVFDRLIATPALKARQVAPSIAWDRAVTRLLWFCIVICLISGAVWLGLATIAMSGLPPQEALRKDVLQVVLSDTHFGRLWEVRFELWLATMAALLLLLVPLPRSALKWLILVLTSGLAATLAGAGHGMDGNHYEWHVLADGLHILIGGIWPAGLLPFAILFLKLRRTDGADKWMAIAQLTRRFSAASLISVSILAGTGLVNSFYMLDGPSDLLKDDYGRVLLAKIIAFLLMVGLGAMNLLRWKPRLSAEYDNHTPTAARRLQMNVAIEAALFLAVLVLVGFLGIMMPPMGGMADMHHAH